MKLALKLAFVLTLFSIPLRIAGAQDAARLVPESGFLSSDMYVNAFFGFCFPLPGDTAYRCARASSNKRSEHNLFGLVQEKGGALLSVSAQQMDSKLSEQLMSVVPRISINGKASKQKKDGGTVWKIMYLTAIDG